MHQDIDLQLFFFFSGASLSGFGIHIMLSLENEFGGVPSSSILQKGLRSLSINSSLNVWQHLSVKISNPGPFFVGRFKILISSPYLVLICSVSISL
jgi:hypothetical protein